MVPKNYDRDKFIESMGTLGVHCVFHYVPLHSSKIGRKIGRVSGDLEITEDLASRLVRIPIWLGIDKLKVSQRLKECVTNCISSK